MTDTPPLNQNIEANLEAFIGTLLNVSSVIVFFTFISGHLEVFLMDVDKSIEAKQSIQDINLVCEVEFQGSTILRYIHIIVSEICLIAKNIF